MVALPRRIAVLIIALIVSLSAAGMALASAQDVINDYRDDGTISSCHPRSDYDAARSVPVDETYGSPQGAIDDALANPALVGTAERPCPVVATAGGGGGGAALVVVPLAVIALGGLLLWSRRKKASEPEAPAGGDG